MNHLLKPLSLIYKNCINTRIFPNIWKNQILSHFIKKKTSRVLIIIEPFFFYLPVLRSLKYIIQYMNFLKKNYHLCEHQSGFKPSDPYEYQLFSIVHYIYASFGFNPPLDVTGIFFDISKAFDRVW